MLKHGILASDRCYSNICQNDKNLKKYEIACHEVFNKISKYIKNDELIKKLDGPIKQMGFKRLT